MPGPHDDEVPEADRLEQAEPVDPDEPAETPPVGGEPPEVDPADWADQQRLEPGDDDRDS